MKWWLLFGGIGVFAVVFYALLGLWFWRRAKALLLELASAADKIEAARPDDLAALPDPPGRGDREPRSAGRSVPPAGHRVVAGRGRTGAGQHR